MTDVYANIEAGKYDNICKYPAGCATDPIIRKMREDYREESKMLSELFYTDCCDDVGLNPKRESSERIFSKAWEDGHAYGYSEVYSKFSDLVEFVQEVVDLRRAED